LRSSPRSSVSQGSEPGVVATVSKLAACACPLLCRA
jgi:hypothetical protein